MTGERARFWVLLAHAMLTQVVTFVVRPAVSYRALELGVPASWLGALSASFAFMPLVLALPAGHVVDRLGERRVVVAGGLLMCSAGAVFLLFGGVYGLVAGNLVLGTGHLCAVVGQQSLVANTTKSSRMDTAFGYYTFATSLGQAIGPVLIAVFGGTRALPTTTPIFQGATGISVLLLACSVALRSGAPAYSGETDSRAGVVSVLRLPGLPRILITSCVVLAAVDISLVYLPALGTERGIASGLIGALLGLRAVASMISRLFLGTVTRWLGRRRLLMISGGTAALALSVVAAPVPMWLLVLSVAVLGIGLGVGQPLTMSWLAESSPPGLRGRAMSLRLTGNRLGQILVPGTVGLVAAGLGAAGVLWVTAAGLAWVGFTARKLSSARTAGE